MNIVVATIVFFSNLYGVDSRVSLAIAKIESEYKQNAVSPAGAYGVMQLRHVAFPEYKLHQLTDLSLNIRLGISHLEYSKKHCGFKQRYQWVICYNRGVAGARRVINPSEDKYYKKFIKEFNRLSNEI